MISQINFNNCNLGVNNQITKRNFHLQQLNSINNSVAFQGKDEFKLSGKETEKPVNPLINEVKGIQLPLKGLDKTIKGYFETLKIDKLEAPKSIKIDGKEIKLPNLNNHNECWKWWNKNVSETPLTVSKEDRAKTRILTKLPANIREKIITTLSKRRTTLTAYDNTELVKYRLDLNKRRIIIDMKDVKPTEKGQAAIKAVSNQIYDNYANSPEGIKKEKKLIVMIGQKASGKTTLVNQARKDHGVIVADSDDIRDAIGYQETELHGRLKALVKQDLAKKAINEGANYLAQFHGTGVNGTLELIKQFKDGGYNDIEIINLEVPEDELVKRIAKRKELSGKDADPLSVVACGHENQLANFLSIFEKANVPSVTAKRYDNDVEYGKPPILIWEKKKVNPFVKAS